MERLFEPNVYFHHTDKHTLVEICEAVILVLSTFFISQIQIFYIDAAKQSHHPFYFPFNPFQELQLSALLYREKLIFPFFLLVVL